jgi:hypothetical protein
VVRGEDEATEAGEDEEADEGVLVADEEADEGVLVVDEEADDGVVKSAKKHKVRMAFISGLIS